MIERASTLRLVHMMTQSRHPFTLVVQRKKISGQQPLDLAQEGTESITSQGYIYRAIATNIKDMSNSEVVHWYKQRGDASENRIKELKHDFGAAKMPCQNEAASALYLSLCMLAYKLFVLLRTFMPGTYESSRIKQVRLRLYALAGKVVKHQRELTLKVQYNCYDFLMSVLSRIRSFEPAL